METDVPIFWNRKYLLRSWYSSFISSRASRCSRKVPERAAHNSMTPSSIRASVDNISAPPPNPGALDTTTKGLFIENCLSLLRTVTFEAFARKNCFTPGIMYAARPNNFFLSRGVCWVIFAVNPTPAVRKK